MLLERVQAVASAGGAIIWLPLQWPVITLRVLETGTQNLLWFIADESFRELSDVAKPVELEITRLSVSPIRHEVSPAAVAFDTLPLRYGEPPLGMRQFFPDGSRPADLKSSISYLIVVRQTWDGDGRWFELRLTSPSG